MVSIAEMAFEPVASSAESATSQEMLSMGAAAEMAYEPLKPVKRRKPRESRKKTK